MRPMLIALLQAFLASECSPAGAFETERQLLRWLRDFGRSISELLYNSLEPDDPDQLHRDLWFEHGGYCRRSDKTANRYVATLFGTITLWRRGYRSWERDNGSIFPLELLLGLVQGATPALVEVIGRQMGEGGASQGRVLDLLRDDHGVCMGAGRLRKITGQLSSSMAIFRQPQQVELLLHALQTAAQSSGSRKPVLAVGRDGITLREYKWRFWEVATAATISVYDRCGKRLVTVYLAWPSELGQATMSRMLDDLLQELLQRWEGPLPQLAYVADCGGNESSWFVDTLRRMVHPRTQQRLLWQRVVDYYHVAERIWTMSDCLFGKSTREGTAWARRMLKVLKKPRGASRVLHSAASLYSRRVLSDTKTENYRRAYEYIRKRTKYLHYSEYKKKHIPLGSGVTEAACKTIFTQRLKLSGMRWTKEGAESILTLRTILLSGIWNKCYASHLQSTNPVSLRPYGQNNTPALKIAA